MPFNPLVFQKSLIFTLMSLPLLAVAVMLCDPLLNIVLHPLRATTVKSKESNCKFLFITTPEKSFKKYFLKLMSLSICRDHQHA
jgi:hypothetical protein